MPSVSVRDARGFFVLPQGFEGGGYYTYGTPTEGRSQYSHPSLMSMLIQTAALWSAVDPRKFGVGNISRENGKNTDHKTHLSGLEVDIRPLRKDGRHVPCTIDDSQYDRDATHKLIAMFLATGRVKELLFNDPPNMPRVRRFRGHDNHFHVAFTA